MSEIGNKVHVPFGKSLTGILEALFLAISGTRAILFGFLPRMETRKP